MSDLIAKATLISYYPPILLASTLFIFFLGFMYGYGVSFIIDLKKAFTVGFFVVLLSSIVILSFTGTQLVSVQCIGLDGSNLCEGSFGTIGPAASTLMLLLSNLIINLAMGHLGLLVGIAFYVPSAWFLTKFTNVSSIKKSTVEYDIINSTSKGVTFGNKPVSEN